MIATNITKKFSTAAAAQNDAVSSIHQNHWKKTTDSLSTLSKHLVDPLSRWLIGCHQEQDDGLAWDRRTSQAHRATHPYPPILRRYFLGVILFFFVAFFGVKIIKVLFGMAWDKRTSQADHAIHPYPPILHTFWCLRIWRYNTRGNTLGMLRKICYVRECK